MKLIRKTDGKFYWLIDHEDIGFAESKDYSSESEAISAAMFGVITWLSIYPPSK
jgi:hypothetical protein